MATKIWAHRGASGYAPENTIPAFKLAVEQAITMNVVAATCNIGREQLEKLRGTCVAQVKRTNGSYSFEDAFDFQKR